MFRLLETLLKKPPTTAVFLIAGGCSLTLSGGFTVSEMPKYLLAGCLWWALTLPSKRVLDSNLLGLSMWVLFGFLPQWLKIDNNCECEHTCLCVAPIHTPHSSENRIDIICFLKGSCEIDLGSFNLWLRFQLFWHVVKQGKLWSRPTPVPLAWCTILPYYDNKQTPNEDQERKITTLMAAWVLGSLNKSPTGQNLEV